MSPTATIASSKIIFTEGLDGQDDHLDILTRLWEQLQLCSAETCHPQLDLITFAQTSFYFAVISEKVDDKDKRDLDEQRYYPPVGTWAPRRYIEENPFDQSASDWDAPLDPWDDDTSSSTDGANWREIPDDEPIIHNLRIDRNRPVGIIYLTESPLVNITDHLGELNIGIILLEDAKGQGYARLAVEYVLQFAFDVKKCHRVQAVIPNSTEKDRALSLFTQSRFSHEGTRRLAFFSPMEQEWKDVTYMGLLDTDRVLFSHLKPAPRSLWDEMFARHAREREELLRWEDKRMRLKRTTSMETVRLVPTAPTDRSVSGTPEPRDHSPSSSKGKKRAVDSTTYRDPSPYDASASGESDAESAVSSSSPHKMRRYEEASPVPSSPAPSTYSQLSVPHSAESDSSDPHSIMSQWDMLESSSEDNSDFWRETTSNDDSLL